MKIKVVVKILVGVVIIGGGIGYFMCQVMQSSWSYYYSVDDFSVNSTAVKNHSLGIVGGIKRGSIVRDLQKKSVNFTLAGSETELPVCYEGSVPDNFAEDREVVIEGRFADEPFTGLDTEASKHFISVLVDFSNNGGTI
jgi:cytochrome c-type biogenesis protein CcmE